jgi:hypothetical protein
MQPAGGHPRRTAPSRPAFWLVAGVFCLLFVVATTGQGILRKVPKP